MAIEKDKQLSPSQRAKNVFSDIVSEEISEPSIRPSERYIESEIAKIYTQASHHRDMLLRFFISYTVISSLFIAGLVVVQVFGMINLGRQLLPEWTLNLLVAGIFGQFIGLLTIVTTRIWTFEPFFKHYSDSHK